MICEKCMRNHDGKYGSGRFCSSFCSRSYSTSKDKETKNKKISEKLKGKYTGLNNSHFKNGKKQKISICPICDNKFNASYSKIYCSRQCYKLDVDFKFRKKVSGGYRRGSGIGKKGWYKNYWCDSSWEHAFVIYNLEHNILFKRNKKYYEYIYDNKKHKYFPDYEMCDGSLVEIKGYETKKDLIKYKSVGGIKIKIFYKKDMLDILNYTIVKYGKNFISLYE